MENVAKIYELPATLKEHEIGYFYKLKWLQKIS